MLPLTQTHPVAWVNPVNLRVSAALPAAGAWDADGDLVIQNIAGASHISFSFSYTRGAENGAFDFQIDWSIYSIVGLAPVGAGEWGTEVIYSGGPVVLSTDTQSEIQQEYQTYGSSGVAIETFFYGPLELGRGVERIRIRGRESADGIIGTPGILQITAELI